MTTSRRLVRAAELAARKPDSETFRSFARFIGDVPIAAGDEFFQLMEDLEQRGIVWISRLDEKKRSEGWALDTVIPGATCLTMGPLEGSLEWHLHKLGAGRIVAIEGNPENRLKCSVLNAIFPEMRAEFILGDVLTTPFPPGADVVFCPGVLYHLTDPHVVLQKIYELRPKLLFLATQLGVSVEHPASEFRRLAGHAQISHHGLTYQGRVFHEGPSKYLAGLDRTQPSIWLYPDDLARLLRDIGFRFEDQYVVDLGPLGVCGSYVCSVPGVEPALRYRISTARRIARSLLGKIARRMSADRLVEKSALRG